MSSCAQEVPPEFSDAERGDLIRYWSQPGRYVSRPVEDRKGEHWRVRATADGSQWLWGYNRARGIGKVPPGQTPPPQNAEQAQWEAWIEARIALDRRRAAAEAARLNGTRVPDPLPDPGPCPTNLEVIAGEPPIFAACVRPNRHEVQFEDVTIAYNDHPDMRPRFAYLRNLEGVQSMGTRIGGLPKAEVDGLLKAAGITPSEARIFRAVSLLEGGFDSVNTYDTGFVSVGFIQFASLAQGGHSLGVALRRMKADDPGAFAEDFRRYGIDVTPGAVLVAVEPRDGTIARGPLANAAIIGDKRLIATFGRAGRRPGFRIAQLRTAKAMYYPADDKLTISHGGRTLTGKVRDVVRSEAGLAALMDRKVNTGNLGPLTPRLALLMSEHPEIGKLSGFAPYEAQLLDALIYRVDTRKDKGLSQPKDGR